MKPPDVFSRGLEKNRSLFLVYLGLMCVPWLNPSASGPSSAFLPWLVSLACATLLIFLWRHIHTVDISASWCTAALLSAILGLIQYFGFATVFEPWVNTTALGEAFANLRQRNQFASLTNIGLLALVWLAGCQRISGPRLIGAAVLLAVGNAASSSRTGLLQLVMVMALIAWWGGLTQPSIRKVLWVAPLAYVTASIALPLLIGLDFGGSGILGRINDGGAACSSRLILWRNVFDLIALKPWLGWGWGELDFAHFTTLYAGPRFCEILDNAHNLPLHLAVELGVPAALGVCGAGLWLVWRAKPWQERDATRQMAWSVLALIMLHSMLEYPLWYGPFQMAFGLCIALLWQRPSTSVAAVEPAQVASVATPVAKSAAVSSAVSTATPVKISSNVPVTTVLYAWTAILIIVFVAYAAWDYHRVSQIYLPPPERSPAYRSNTMAKIQGSWLFQNQVRFAELTTTRLTPDNASKINAMAHELLHFSPEARVAEKLIDSAWLLGRLDEARYFEARYRSAFPQEHANWAKASAMKR